MPTMDIKKSSSKPVNLLDEYLKTKPRTLLITSYTLGLSYLEKKLLSTLKKKFDTKISIVTSDLALKESFDETVSLNGVGTVYYLFQINNSPYAFHPKLYFAVDEKDDLTIFAGGANFTYTGMCLNLDAIEELSGNEIDSLSKKNIASFLNKLEIGIKSSELQKICNKIKMVLDKTVTNKTSDVFFVHNTEESIFAQVKRFVKEEVTDLRIVSPYYDKDMGAVKKIIRDLNISSCQLLCNKDDKAVNLASLPEKVQVCIPEFCEGEQPRFVHAKAFVFKTKDNIYTCVGSANCTHAGFMSTSKKGNWEACILRRQNKNDDADEFWNSFFPKKIAKTDYWIYKAPEKPAKPDANTLSFNALLTYNILKIVPLSNFPSMPFDAMITFNLKNSDEETIYLNNITEEIQVEIDASLKERFGADPVSVEFKIIIPKMQGRTWVMQEHQLRKTNKIRSLEKAIDQLRTGDSQGWDQVLDIINFVVENLGYVSARPRAGTNKAKKKDTSHKIPLITGVVSIDEEIYSHGQSFILGDFADFGNSLAKLIEKGMTKNIDFEEEGGEDGVVEEEAATPGVNRASDEPKSINNKKPSSSTPVIDPLKRHDIIEQIPSVTDVFQTKICKPFLSYLRKAENSKKPENMERFESLLDLMNFCLKFTRFLRLELCRHDSMQEESLLVKKYLMETAMILRWFWRTYPEIVKKDCFSNKFFHDAFIKTGTLNEMSLCLMEFWSTNQEDHFLNREVFFYAIDIFRSLYGNEYFKKSILQHLKSNERFNKDRENLLFTQDSSKEILLNIEKFNDRKQAIGKIIERQMKYHYWVDASHYHEYALKRYETSPLLPRANYAEHQRRFLIASKLIKQCKADGIKNFGEEFCAKLYDYQKVAGISEIKNELVCAFCSDCNQQMGMDIYQTLKKFEWFECPHCKKLFIPVDKPMKYSFADTRNDPEWELELKETE
jgi:hypothetical protein